VHGIRSQKWLCVKPRTPSDCDIDSIARISLALQILFFQVAGAQYSFTAAIGTAIPAAA
jgi:hypothetical protein